MSMQYRTKNIPLKNGKQAVFRSPEPQDAKEMNEFLRTSAAETNFLMRYPEEYTQTEEAEAGFLEQIRTSPYVLMIVCTVDGVIAGNATLSFQPGLKTKHRAEAAIALLQAYWGMGIGTAMLAEMEAIAKERGIVQLELEYMAGNERGSALYRKMGFVQVAEHPDAIRLKDGTLHSVFTMVKKL